MHAMKIARKFLRFVPKIPYVNISMISMKSPIELSTLGILLELKDICEKFS